MGAERFNVTGRGPSTSYLAIICTEEDLSHVSLFYILFHFIFFFYVQETGHFLAQKILPVQADEKVGSMQPFWVNLDNPSRPGDLYINPLVMTTPFGSRCFATVRESIKCQQHIAPSTSKKAEAAQSYKTYLLPYMILTEAQFSLLPQCTEIPLYVPKSTVHFSCWKILEAKFKINPTYWCFWPITFLPVTLH